MKIFFVVIVISIINVNIIASGYIEKGNTKYLPDRLLVKFKQNENNTTGALSLSKSSSNRLSQFGILSLKSKFNAESIYKEKLNSIYELKLSSPYDPQYAAVKISKLPEIEWAEPYYIYELADQPNDPNYVQQYALKKVQAEEAWIINKGDPSIIIAIVDTGVYWEHPDLNSNIWINQAEANGIAGVDDDNNGYVDDIRGWDFGGLNGTPDNNPAEDNPDHGTHVAGIAGAVTNNGIGVASISYNCKIMAVKTAQNDLRDNSGRALISHGYQGIIYAVDNGAKIINCSWGSYSYSRTFQEILDYAVTNGALLVGAAGNEALQDAIYPGAYKGALSVGYSNSSDVKDNFSNYGEKVDLFAPGTTIISTWQNSSYVSLSGSSMAAPMVAGIAALVMKKYPDYNPLQIAEQIRVNADNIDDKNSVYRYLMGSGRVNAYKALLNSESKSVRKESLKFIDLGDGDGILESGERVAVDVEFVNYLKPLENFSVKLVTDNPFILLDNSTLNLGAKSTLEKFNNSGNPLSFVINSGTPLNTEVSFRLEYSDGQYSDFEFTDEIVINPLYKTTSVNDIAVTITSKGTIGYNDYPTNLQGDGFKYNSGNSILFEGGLMYGISSDKIVSTVRSSNQDIQSNDFRMVQPFMIQTPGDIADEQGLSVFNDDNAGTRKFNIQTELHTYAFADDESKDFLILKYIFKNLSTQDYTNFYAGLYFDWDIDGSSAEQNYAKYDNTGKFGYAYPGGSATATENVAVALLSGGNDGFYAILNGGDTGFGVWDGFFDSEKWLSMTNQRFKSTAGLGDISTVSSSGPHVIPVNGQLEVAFALAAGDSLSALKDAVARSRDKYKIVITDVNQEVSVPNKFLLEQNYPNPFNPTTTIEYSIPQSGFGIQNPQGSEFVTLTVYDILGKEIATIVDQRQAPGKYSVLFNAGKLASGVYFYKLKYGAFVGAKKMILVR